MKKGKFITFEGIDGCGKTTQMGLLKKYLEEKKYNITETLEPGGCNLGQKLRQILLHYEGFVDEVCETFLYLADRAQHVQEVIIENINKGNIVLCDRYTDSTLAYQGYARGLDLERLESLNNIATKNLRPDITFVFDIDTEIAQKRLGREKDRLERENLDFHQKVKEGYLALAKKHPERIKIIDAKRSIDEIFEEVKTQVDKIL